MTDELTPTQALALWGLLARQGRAPEKDVKPVTARAALISAKLVESDKPSKTVSLTDRGWNWASEHLKSPALQKQPVLTLLLGHLGSYLEAGRGTLADLIGQAPPLPEPPPRPPKAQELRKLIEDAYLRITGGKFDEAVRLSRLRDELAPHTRKTVDAGLKRINNAKREKARLGQLSDNKAIDAAEREAAFMSEAAESLHLLWIKP